MGLHIGHAGVTADDEILNGVRPLHHSIGIDGRTCDIVD
jgi:hypothetical protein